MSTETTLLRTPLYERHIAAGAKMVGFAGFDMPISYSGLREEHEAVRQNVGMFDVSHMGEFIVRGKGALDLLQHLTSNDVSKLKIGQAQYSAMPTPEGGIVDDLLIYRLPEDQCAEGERSYMLVVNASNMAKDWAWIEKHNQFDTRVIDISQDTALLAVQGPKAAEALQGLCEVQLRDLAYYTFVKTRFAGVDNVIVSATGYTGAGGFELYIPADNALDVWDAIIAGKGVEGKGVQVMPVGLGARDSLRLEMGFALYGNDIDDSTSMLEAGLGWITKLDKGEFIGRDYLEKQQAEGIKRRLVGLRIHDRRVARHGHPIVNEAGESIGYITSGTQSPTLGYPIALGYVPFGQHKPGSKHLVDVGSKVLDAEVVRIPFARAQQ